MAAMMHAGRRLGIVVAGWTGLFVAVAFLLVNVGMPRMGCGCEDAKGWPTTQQVQTEADDGATGEGG